MPKRKPQKAPEPRLERSTFKVSRELEYFSQDELSKQIGHDINVWPLAITKELIDNALDACEAIPVSPLITVTVEGDRVAVADNAGTGLKESTLRGSLDYTITVSDKAHYKSPVRGRQGNALKTVWAAPFVYNGGCEGDGQGRIQVITPSYAYQILASLDQIAQKPEINVTALDQPFVKTGTVVTVDWKRRVSSYLDENEDEDEKPDFYKDALGLLQSYALFNPHAGFTLSGKGQTVEIAKPLINGWQKWLPSDPTSPHWYDVESLSRLIGAMITNDHGQQTVREFVSEFRGLTSTIRQKRVVSAADLERLRLCDLRTSDGKAINTVAVGRLLKAMCEESKMVKARQFGIIGKEALSTRLVEIYGVNPESIRYDLKLAEGPEPAVMETILGIRQTQTEAVRDEDSEMVSDGRRLQFGINFSPALKVPFKSAPYALQRVMIESVDPIVLVNHAVSAHIQFSDRGKAAVSGGKGYE